MNELCDKCKQPVEDKDNLIMMMVRAGLMSSVALLFLQFRHIRCSPSRAQYIFDEVIDDRPEYDKRLRPPEEQEKWTKIYRKAYQELQNS